MGPFIRFKKIKIENVFRSLGDNCSEEDFIITFKFLYPDDWQKIQNLWLYDVGGKMNLLPQCQILLDICTLRRTVYGAGKEASNA